MASNRARTKTRLSFQTASRHWPTERQIGDVVKEQLSTKYFPPWSQAFFFVSFVAGFLDLLYPYSLFLKLDTRGVWTDEFLFNAYILYRSIADLFYAVDVCMFVWRIITSSNGRKCMCLAECSPAILRGIFVALPFPQVVRLYKYDVTFSRVCSFLFFVQYVLRIVAYHRSVKLLYCRFDNENGVRVLPKALLGSLPFILAAHLFGSLRYYHNVGRIERCWMSPCKDDEGWNSSCISSCNREEIKNMKLLNILDKLHRILTIPTFRTIFDHGMTKSRDSLGKRLLGSWWGLENLSSYGSNLQTILNEVVDITFFIIVSVSGLLLILIYLNGRLQASTKKSKDDKLRLKIQALYPQIDLWISQNGLSLMPESIAKQVKKAIIENARQKIEEKQDVDLEDIFSLLPKIYKDYIMRLLGPALLRNVRMFQFTDEVVLGKICDLFKPVTFAVGKYILQEGELHQKVVFIRRGIAFSYSTISVTAIARPTSRVCLQQGDVCGGELLDWAFIRGAPLSEVPICTTVVKAQTKVEGFAIRANDLATFLLRSWYHFPNMELRQVWATCCIQVMWRIHRARVASSSNPSGVI